MLLSLLHQATWWNPDFKLYCSLLLPPSDIIALTSWLLPLSLKSKSHDWILRRTNIAPPSLQTTWQNPSHMAAFFTTDQYGCLLLPYYPLADQPSLSAHSHDRFLREAEVAPLLIPACPYFKCWSGASYLSSYQTPPKMATFASSLYVLPSLSCHFVSGQDYPMILEPLPSNLSWRWSIG